MLDTFVSIGDTLKEIRETKGFQLQEVAKETAINYTILSRIETGKRLPTKPQVQNLANFYNYSEEALIKHLISDKILNEVQSEDFGLEGFHLAEQKIKYGLSLFNDYKHLEKFELHSRRYIGNKAKLTEWIMKIIQKETTGTGTFIDIFSGTAIIAKEAMKTYKNVVLNDILYSNNIVYQAFFDNKKWSSKKIIDIVNEYNILNPKEIKENYFSKNFGGKFYEKDISKLIGHIRQDIENRKDKLNSKEYAILLTSLIYTIDRLANTVGHFDAYIKKPIAKRSLNFRLIQTQDFAGAKIYRDDSNKLVRKLKGDVAYIDPPYNSRQYSRFYHIYENLVQWEKPKLYGVALKPEPDNMSKYCTVQAKNAFKDLVENLDVKYLAVSYNNTYKSKSKSSANKIKLEEIIEILNKLGETKIYEQSHKFFSTGKTDFNDHKEFLFLTKKYD
ncbi:MAG: DNA adenine methylase [Bacteroidales bacterium]|nr:DNA adenine methylase [Bacteroidales bacterium]MDD4217597.1 DNA adenine methylase [Bacteroidales bacterium]MDY0141837.1 DNA adenine methylase [Bacteroidales bacterium]